MALDQLQTLVAAIAPQVGSMHFGPVTVILGDRSGKYPDGNQILLQGRDARAVFDTPRVSRQFTAGLGEWFETVDLAILGHVHEDHVVGLPRLKYATIHVHQGDLAAARSWAGLARHYGYEPDVLAQLRQQIERDFDWQPCAQAQGYDDGARWDLGGITVHAVHLPGHTSGHCVLMIEPMGIAFLGDIDLTGFGPYYGDATSSLSDFRDTLARVRDLPASTWVTSHHRGVIQDRATFESALTAFAGKIEQRSERILTLLQNGPCTIEDLVRARVLYPPHATAIWLDGAERRTILQHLDELVMEGLVEQRDDGRFQRRTLSAAC
jgi:glyoxylase-like metal-dependent hydrolase (beta-lactamase superfamily II)